MIFKNLASFIETGFNHILGTPDPIVTKKLTHLSFKHMGDPFQLLFTVNITSQLQ